MVYVKYHKIVGGKTTFRNPLRHHSTKDSNIPKEILGGTIEREDEPVRRATEKLKHLTIKKSKPVKKYISFG